METELKYQDLMYFGYDWSEESEQNKQNEIDFMREAKEKFPNIKFKDAYDNIKGFRQEVYLDEANDDNYFSWLIGSQWHELSFTFKMLTMSAGSDPEQLKKFDKYVSLAKKQYPEVFKPEALENNG